MIQTPAGVVSTGMRTVRNVVEVIRGQCKWLIWMGVLALGCSGGGELQAGPDDAPVDGDGGDHSWVERHAASALWRQELFGL